MFRHILGHLQVVSYSLESKVSYNLPVGHLTLQAIRNNMKMA